MIRANGAVNNFIYGCGLRTEERSAGKCRSQGYFAFKNIDRKSQIETTWRRSIFIGSLRGDVKVVAFGGTNFLLRKTLLVSDQFQNCLKGTGVSFHSSLKGLRPIKLKCFLLPQMKPLTDINSMAPFFPVCLHHYIYQISKTCLQA